MDKEKFHKAQEDCQKVVDWLNIPLTRIAFTDELIAFNGAGDNAYETFYVSRQYKHPFLNNPEPTEEGYFTFCKTARRPYDAAVTACLVILKHYFGDDIKVKSDGYPDEWSEGLIAVQECLKYGAIPFQKG